MKEVLDKLKKEKVYDVRFWFRIPLWFHLVYMLVIFMLGGIGWLMQYKVNGWCP